MTLVVGDVPAYTVAVKGFERLLNAKKPHVIGTFRVRIEPVGIQVNGIRVAKDREGTVIVNLPATPISGGWAPNVILPTPLHNALRAAIMDHLAECGLVQRKAKPEPAPLRYDPDAAEPEDEIPLPETILGATSE